MKKTMHKLWALLPVAAALLLASCSASDDTLEQTQEPNGKGEQTTIPCTIQVGYGDDITRATVDDDNSTLLFHSADQLAVIYNNSCIGKLECTSGSGTASATFEGTLSGTNLPSTFSSVKVVLIGENNIGVNESNGYEWNNDSHAICTSLNDAVEKYSYLTATGSFDPNGSNSFTLEQHTSFLNINVEFLAGVNGGVTKSVVVKNRTAAGVEETIGSGSFTTTASTKTVKDVNIAELENNSWDDMQFDDMEINISVANFVVPIAEGTTLDGATIAIDGVETMFFVGNSTFTLDPKSYRVTKYVIDGHEGVQLWENGPYWATRNIGAVTPTDKGYYFAWGETATKNSYDVYSYTWLVYEDWNATYDKYGPELKRVLDPEDDAASVAWTGGHWRMPMVAELAKLTNLTWFDDYITEYKYKLYSSDEGANGVVIRSDDEHNPVFFPATGYYENDEITDIDGENIGWYWSKEYPDWGYWEDPNAYCLNVSFRDNTGSNVNINNWYAEYGLAVRAVCTFSN